MGRLAWVMGWHGTRLLPRGAAWSGEEERCFPNRTPFDAAGKALPRVAGTQPPAPSHVGLRGTGWLHIGDAVPASQIFRLCASATRVRDGGFGSRSLLVP